MGVDKSKIICYNMFVSLKKAYYYKILTEGGKSTMKNRVNVVRFEECFCEFWCECVSGHFGVQSNSERQDS